MSKTFQNFSESEIEQYFTENTFNPSIETTVQDWPIGRQKRGTMCFEIEDGGKKGQRCQRWQPGKNKTAANRTTYHRKMQILTTADGETVIIGYTDYGQITMVYGTLKYPAYIYPDKNPKAFKVCKKFLEIN